MKSRSPESRFDRWWWRSWYVFAVLVVVWLAWCAWLGRPAAPWAQGWVGWWTGDAVGSRPLWYFHANRNLGAEVIPADGNPAFRNGWGSTIDLGTWREKRSQFTWAGWVRIQPDGNQWPEGFVIFRSMSAPDMEILIGVEGALPVVRLRHFHGSFPNGVAEFQLRGPQPLPMDQWFHLAVSSDGGLQRILIDGTNAATAFGMIHPQLFVSSVSLRNGDFQPARGSRRSCIVDQDDLILYDRAVPPEELQALVQRGRGGWLPELERSQQARRWRSFGTPAALVGILALLTLKLIPRARRWATQALAASHEPLFRPVRWTLAVGLVITGLFSGALWMQERGVDERRFHELVQNFGRDVDNDWDSLSGLLARARDWISVQTNLNLEMWDTWLLANRFPQAYPGVVGAGYAQQVLPADLTAHETEWSARHGIQYRVHPSFPGDRQSLSELEGNPMLPVVLYETRRLDPKLWKTNHSILGRDLLYQDPGDRRPWAAVRRVEESVARNEVQTSSLEEIAPAGWYGAPVMGLYLYMPITLRTKVDSPEATLEPDAWRGLVFATVDFERMLRDRLGNHASPIGFKVFTARSNGERFDLVADSTKFLPETRDPSRAYLHQTLITSFFYRRLTIDFWTTPAFEAQSLRRWPYITGATGLAFTFLMATLLVVQLRAREAQGRVLEALRVANSDLLIAYRQREQLSRDLHDGSIQNLYALGLHLQRVQTLLESAPKRARDELTDSLTLLDQSIAELRQFILTAGVDNNPQPSVASALESLFQRLRKTTNVDLELHVDPQSERLDASAGVQVLNVVREAVSNALRHAGARRIEVRLDRVGSTGSPNGESEHWRLGVSDDGCGFNLTNTPRPGRGLNNLAARAAELGGQSVIDSKPGQGTRVILEFPC